MVLRLVRVPFEKLWHRFRDGAVEEWLWIVSRDCDAASRHPSFERAK